MDYLPEIITIICIALTTLYYVLKMTKIVPKKTAELIPSKIDMVFALLVLVILIVLLSVMYFER